MLKNFDIKSYSQLDVSEKGKFVGNYVLKEFSMRFYKGEEVSQDTFNKIVSQDRKIRKWVRDLKVELESISKLPNYSLLEGAPKEAHDIILSEAKKLSDFNESAEKEVKLAVSEYKAKLKVVDEKRLKEYKNFSFYTLVSTLTIDDVPLMDKRKIFIESDEDKIKIFRKDIVTEYKKKCFENLIKNGGVFSTDFENPFELK